MATMTLNVEANPIVACSDDINAGGGTGIYEYTINVGTDTGWTGIIYDAAGIPDRFEIYYDNIRVADSKFVGDAIANPASPYGGITLGPYTLDNYIYDGTDFITTGDTTDITIAASDIADNITEPTNGNGILLFNKTTANPNTIKIIATGSPAGSTAWQIEGVCPTPEEDLIEGDEVFVYTFFTEPNKANQTRSAKFVLGTSPVKFYTNKLGDTNFNNFGYTVSTQYINDGTTWYQLDASGNILSTGAI
jgi:hypothetical protein